MTEILEKGTVSFHQWPAPGVREPRGPEDVQRFFLVLQPEGGGPARRLLVGQKKLPDAGPEGAPGGDADGERHWGFVDRVVDDPAAATERTDGNLDGPPAREAARGRYAIVRHEGHTDFAYELDAPARPRDAEEAFHLAPAASYVLTIKNPEARSPPGVGLDREARARFPDDLQARFGDRRWASADPPAFLDVEGAEFLLVAGRDGADAPNLP